LGHRGARACAPENTIAAFDLALEHGCDGFEFDVRRTSDCKPVVCHDGRVRGVELATHTYGELLAVDANIPLLETVLERYKNRSFLYIELKVAGMETQIPALLEKCPPQCGYVVASFLPEVLNDVHRCEPRIPLGFICDKKSEIANWRRLPVHYVMPNRRLTTPRLLTDVHSTGKKLFVWTVNDAEEMKIFAAMHADGILSDNTALLSSTLNGTEG
jgi:glycerophosphoryl diester phosphodiesterase